MFPSGFPCSRLSAPGALIESFWQLRTALLLVVIRTLLKQEHQRLRVLTAGREGLERRCSKKKIVREVGKSLRAVQRRDALLPQATL